VCQTVSLASLDTLECRVLRVARGAAHPPPIEGIVLIWPKKMPQSNLLPVSTLWQRTTNNMVWGTTQAWCTRRNRLCLKCRKLLLGVRPWRNLWKIGRAKVVHFLGDSSKCWTLWRYSSQTTEIRWGGGAKPCVQRRILPNK
jgi:hypothetical protein